MEKESSRSFDSNWRKRLKDYPQSLEYQKNLNLLKEEIDKTLPKTKPKKKLVFVFMGIPGSGKSTIAQIIKESIHPSVILHSDWIFFEKLKNQIEDDYYKAYVYQEELARQYLKDDYSVIMDENNRTVKNRSEIYKWAKQYGAQPILVKIDVYLRKAAERLTLKGKEIKTKVEIIEGLKTFASQTEEPTIREGVKIIKINGNKKISEIIKQLKKDFSSLN